MKTIFFISTTLLFVTPSFAKKEDFKGHLEVNGTLTLESKKGPKSLASGPADASLRERGFFGTIFRRGGKGHELTLRSGNDQFQIFLPAASLQPDKSYQAGPAANGQPGIQAKFEESTDTLGIRTEIKTSSCSYLTSCYECNVIQPDGSLGCGVTTGYCGSGLETNEYRVTDLKTRATLTLTSETGSAVVRTERDHSKSVAIRQIESCR